jgi:CTP:phosphocholine cytidylyltransferase-like protein/thiamine kinase-like enzyme
MNEEKTPPKRYRVDNAIILAAGLGARMVPLTYETPKGLIPVKGRPMVERQIEQLRARGVGEIVVVVGYLREQFDYLTDKYGVTLVYNPEYEEKNNLFSLYHALDHLKNSYVLAADTRLEENMFAAQESHSWYSCVYFEGATDEWGVSANGDGRITRIDACGRDTWALYGPAFFTETFSEKFAELIRAYCGRPGAENYYWEDVLRENLTDLPIYMNRQSRDNIREFENVPDLRAFDERYRDAGIDPVLQKIAQTFGVKGEEITGIEPLEGGMTNYSLVFRIGEQAYVFRTPGAGTEKLVDRAQEKEVYGAVAGLGIADEVVCIGADDGIKIAKYYDGVHTADVSSEADLRECVRLIRLVHGSGVRVKKSFDIGGMIEYYVALADEAGATRFADRDEVRDDMRRLLEKLEEPAVPETLCHGDFVPTNVLIDERGRGRLIDWEYSAMGDSVMDIAMFVIYARMDRSAAEHFLGMYEGGKPGRGALRRFYLSIALSGFLWTVWTEYKQARGKDFGDYGFAMYRYAKEYYAILLEEGYLE